MLSYFSIAVFALTLVHGHPTKKLIATVQSTSTFAEPGDCREALDDYVKSMVRGRKHGKASGKIYIDGVCRPAKQRQA